MKRFSLIICAVFALSCSQQREDEGIPANFAAPSQPEESQAETEEAGAADEEVSAEPAPADLPAAEPAREVEDSARERSSEVPKTAAPKRSARPSAAPSGCPDQTCFEKCKSFGAAKQSGCAQAYSRGCFSPERDPLNCGEFGVGEAEESSTPADENVGEMPVPRLD